MQGLAINMPSFKWGWRLLIRLDEEPDLVVLFLNLTRPTTGMFAGKKEQRSSSARHFVDAVCGAVSGF
jgi:hypothetical protein